MMLAQTLFHTALSATFYPVSPMAFAVAVS